MEDTNRIAVYSAELRNGYVCSWCQVVRSQPMVIPRAPCRQDVRRRIQMTGDFGKNTKWLATDKIRTQKKRLDTQNHVLPKLSAQNRMLHNSQAAAENRTTEGFGQP